MRIGSLVIAVLALVGGVSPIPAAAQDECKLALELATRARHLYGQVGGDLSPRTCSGLKDRIAKFDAAADAFKETLRAANALCRPAPTPDFDEAGRVSSMKDALEALEQCRRAGKGD